MSHRVTFSELVDAVVLISGAARGIGLACAQIFAAHGSKIGMIDLDQQVCEDSVKEIAAAGGSALPLVGDITDEAACKTMVEELFAKWGRIDTLINNAGITRDSPFVRLKNADWHAVLQVNLDGAYYLTKETVNKMRKARKGSIINMSSMSRAGNMGQTNYATAKAGMVGFTRSLAKELALWNIRVNAIAPGFIDTRLTEVLSDKVKESILSYVPMKRMGTVHEVAAAALYLASNMSTYTSGSVIDINGGIGVV